MNIRTAIEATLDRAESAADRAYQLAQEEKHREWLDRQPVNWKAEAIRWEASFNAECERYVEARVKIGAMDETIYRMRMALLEIRDELEEHFDIEDGENGPLPNWAMKLGTLIDEATGRRP